jgi:hypothetical protein
MRTRLELYEQLAERVGDRRAPLPADGLAELSVLLEEEPPIRDYGPRAGERNERIATILAQLDGAVR